MPRKSAPRSAIRRRHVCTAFLHPILLLRPGGSLAPQQKSGTAHGVFRNRNANRSASLSSNRNRTGDPENFSRSGNPFH